MKTIYLLQKIYRHYGSAPKILRAYDSQAEADDLIELMKKAEVEDLVVVEIEMQTDVRPKPAPPVGQAPLLPRLNPQFVSADANHVKAVDA
jgi:hypothetical protein